MTHAAELAEPKFPVNLEADHQYSTPLPPGVASPQKIEGKVEGGGDPIVNATVTLWAAGPCVPQKLSETQTKGDGSFELEIAGRKDNASVLYLIANGGEPKARGDKGPNPEIRL